MESRPTRPPTPEGGRKQLQLKIFEFIGESDEPKSTEEIADQFNISLEEAGHHCDRLEEENAPIKFIRRSGKFGWIKV